MLYSIGEVSKMTDLNVSTLRYYDKEGLLPNIKRDKNSIRKFDKGDLNALLLIDCLKNSGMQIKEIKDFMDLCLEGNKTLEKRLDFFKKQEVVIKEKIDELNETMDMIKFKQWYYETAVKNNDENFVKNMNFNDMPKDIQILYKNTH